MITVLAGGVGAARLLAGLVEVVDPSDVTIVANTGDDARFHGLHVSPDLDTICYTLAGEVNPATGWGLVGESWQAMASLDRYGGETWFQLGDRDLGTHLYRTGRLLAGATLSEVTAEITRALGLAVRLLPMSDDPVRTRLELLEGGEVDFQDYFVRLHHDVPVRSVRFDGADSARPAAFVLEALEEAAMVVVAPSNPIVSIGPILAVPGIGPLLAARRERVVAISPIVDGVALKGPADRLLRELGHESSVVGVARLLSAVAGTLVIDRSDERLAGAVEEAGMRCVVADTVMRTRAVAAALGELAIAAAR